MNKTVHCVGCEGGIEALDEKVIRERLAELTDWVYDSEKKCLFKKFQFKGFLRTMSFVNAIAWMANEEKHHPDLEVSYNSCTVRYQTHAVSGVTENDFICVYKIEELLN